MQPSIFLLISPMVLEHGGYSKEARYWGNSEIPLSRHVQPLKPAGAFGCSIAPPRRFGRHRGR